MVVDPFLLTVAIVSIIASAFTAYFAYATYRYNRLRTGWLAVVYGTILAIFVRIIPFLRDLGLFTISPQTFTIVNGILLTIISIAVAWGFYSIKKSFETFDVVEKKTARKIAQFESKRKR